MISRYNRRPVSHKLEIRGLSRSSLDNHPLPEGADDTRVPHRFLHDLDESVSTHSSSETSAASGRSDCPTVITGDTGHLWSGIHSYTGTGISTERSSVFSWGYDEFDRAASRQVQQLFEEIDEVLYEGKASTEGGQVAALQDECQQWAARFPHLRILGSGLACPGEQGFHWHTTAARGHSAGQDTSKALEKDAGSIELNVQGQRAVLCDLPAAEHDGTPDPPGEAGVIVSEGLMEEYLAFDCSEPDGEWQHQAPEAGRRRQRLPPVSPSCCRRQAVLDVLFDDVWRQLVGWMAELVQRHWEGCVSDEERNSLGFSPVHSDPQNPLVLLSALPTLPRLGQARAPPHPPGPQPQPSRVPVSAVASHRHLNELMVIHGIPLQQRHLGAPDRPQDIDERLERLSHRPGSGAVPSGRPRPRRALEQSFSSLSRPAQSARRRNPPPRTLLPLVPSPSQSSATGSMDEVIRGTRLPTATERLSSPLVQLSRNTLLPPIGTADPDAHMGSQPRPTQRARGSPSRAHSAVSQEAACSLLRDRHHLLEAFSRPNTTHTYRSDTPYRRSFTVLDNIGPGRPGRASGGTDSLGIGVTGISLALSSSSFLDSVSHHPLGHSPIEDEEEPDPQAPLPALALAVSVPSRPAARGGVSSRGRPGV